MKIQTMPYQLVVIFHLPTGDSEVYGMFDSDDEAWEYVDAASGELPEGSTAELQLLFPK